jgi:hypothetical protein
MKTGAIFIVAVAVWTALTGVKAATYSLGPAADARVLNYPGLQNQNYVSDILSVYTDSSGLNTQRTFIQFDLSSITLNSTQIVQSATLTLFAGTGFGNNPNHLPMDVYRLVAPWAESGLSWSNRDASHTWATPGGDFVGLNGQPYAISTTSPTNNQGVTWDVTTLVQEWVTHAATNYGLLLKSENGNLLIFNQREAGTSALRPNLTVVVGPGLPSFHFYSSGGQVVLWWTGTNSILQEKTNLNPASLWSDSGRPVSSFNGSNSVTIPAPAGNKFFRLRDGP